jgi:hypothetical protein
MTAEAVTRAAKVSVQSSGSPARADTHWNTEAPQTLQSQRSREEEAMRLQMNKAIDDLAYAKAANWDGEDADPVDQSIIGVARELARLMTGPVTSVGEAPEIYPTPRGEIDFSWNIDGRMLIIGICPPEPTIVYAGMAGDFDIRGRVTWAGTLHPAVRACLEALIIPLHE